MLVVLLAAMLQTAAPGAGDFAAGAKAFAAHRYGEAAAALSRAVVAQPDNAHWWKALGAAQAARASYPLAAEAFARACLLDPAEPDACFFRARALYALDRYQAAWDVLQRLRSSDPDPARVEEALAESAEALGRLGTAMTLYRQAFARAPGRHSLAYGRFLVRLGRDAEAIAVLRTALAADPDSAAAQFELGRAYLESGQLDAAVTALTQAVALAPADVAMQRVLAKARARRAAGRP